MSRPGLLRRASAALIACGLLAAGCGGAGETGRPQRVVLITLDTLRADALSSELSESTMPATARLAADGLLFDNFYATTSTTQPSHASLFTSRYPWKHGVTRNGIVLEEFNHTLAEELQAAGYATHAVVASFPLHERFGYAQGFDRFEDDFDEPYVQVWEGQPTEDGLFFSLARSVTRQALAALDAAEGDRQFFWFHYYDPHDPYGDTAAQEAPGTGGLVSVGELNYLAAKERPEVHARLAEARREYDRDLRAMDRELEQLYDRLARDAATIDTHILVTADHGESFGERGAIGHGKRVTREQVQVPFVLHSPRIEPGVRGDGASLLDLPRTILSLVGHGSDAFGGRDLTRPATAADNEVFGMRRSFSEPKSEATLSGSVGPLPETWYFTVQGRRLVSGNGDTLLEEDDRSRVLTGADHAELLDMFSKFDRLQAAGPEATELLDEDVQGVLEALGYVDGEGDD